MSMLRIAYCDDNEQDRQSIMAALSKIEESWSDTFEIHPFSSGESLCESLLSNSYDVILLDILMKGIDGIETAARIRKLSTNVFIIFISGYDARVKDLFPFQAIGFIDKPVVSSKLERSLKQVYSSIEANRNLLFSYKKGSISSHVPLDEIVYFESQKNSIIIHTEISEYTFYDTLYNVWDRVKATESFVKPHKSYIFNLNKVTLRKNILIIRKTNEVFNIGAKYKDDTLEKYVNFLNKRMV